MHLKIHVLHRASLCPLHRGGDHCLGACCASSSAEAFSGRALVTTCADRAGSCSLTLPSAGGGDAKSQSLEGDFLTGRVILLM